MTSFSHFIISQVRSRARNGSTQLTILSTFVSYHKYEGNPTRRNSICWVSYNSWGLRSALIKFKILFPTIQLAIIVQRKTAKNASDFPYILQTGSDKSSVNQIEEISYSSTSSRFLSSSPIGISRLSFDTLAQIHRNVSSPWVLSFIISTFFIFILFIKTMD